MNSYRTYEGGYVELTGVYCSEIHDEQCAWSVEFMDVFNRWANAWPMHLFTLEYALERVKDGTHYSSAIHMARQSRIPIQWRLRNAHTNETIPGEVFAIDP